MKHKTKILLHILFVAFAIIAAIGITGTTEAAYAVTDTDNDGVCFEEAYAAPGESLTVNYEGDEAGPDYKWYIDGELVDCVTESFAVVEYHYQKMIKVEVWAGDNKLGEEEVFCSKLPVVYIDTDGGQEVVSKDDYIDAQIHIQGNELYNTDNSTLYTGATEIKGRGNSTWTLFDKKPYKLKLDKKTSLFGLGKNKHWVLLANYIDESGMRNMLAGDIATRMNVGAMDGTWVEVIMNGENLGTYMLCEHVRLSEDRVNVFDWETAAEDIAEAIAEGNGLSEDDMDALTDQMAEEDMSWISTGEVAFNGVTYKTADYYEDLPSSFSGGYLLEMDTGYDEVSKFTTDNGAPLMFKSPEFINTDEVAMSTVQNYIQNFEDALYSKDHCTEINGEEVSYTELCDVESFASYLLASELLMNEVGYKSTYFQKDIDQPLVFGPVWDFDFSSGVVSPFGAQSATDWTSVELRASGNSKWWIGEAVTDPYFVVKLRNAYIEQEEYLKYVIAEDGLLDEWYDYLYESGTYNSELWQYSRGFEADYDALVSWLTKRINWMDKQFASNDTAMASFGILFSDKFDLELQGDGIVYSEGKSYTATVDGENLVLNVNAKEVNYTDLNYYINGKYAGAAELTDGIANILIREELLTEDIGLDNVINVWLKDENGQLIEQQYLTVKLTSDTTFYNVVFNDMGGTYANKVGVGKKVYLDEPLHQAANAVFEGWSDGTVTYDAGEWMPVNGDIALNAVWTTCTDGTYVHELTGEEDVLTCSREGCTATKSSGKTYTDIAVCTFAQSSKYFNYYTGTPTGPVITITDHGKTLVENKDYTIEYKNNIDVGYATYIVKGIKAAGYDGEVSMSYRILPRGIYKATVSMPAGCELVDGVAEPKAVLSYNGITLVEGTDYTVTYLDNTTYGTATVKFEGKGNFTGTMVRKYEVTRSINTCTFSGLEETKGYTGKAINPKVTVMDGEQLLTAGTHYRVNYSNCVKCGTAKVTITGIAKGGYSGTQELTFKIRPAKTTAKVANVTYNKQKVTWSKVAGATKYNVFRSTDNKTFKLVKTVTANQNRVYNSTNLKTGKTYYYKVRAVISQTNGTKTTNYLGTMSNVAKLKPVLFKGNVTSVKNTAASTATIKWKGINGAQGYKIYRSTTNKAGSFKVIKTVKVGFGKTYKDTKLKKGKTYYYKVRAYRKVDGKLVYGNLSTSKGVKIKK